MAKHRKLRAAIVAVLVVLSVSLLAQTASAAQFGPIIPMQAHSNF